LKSWGVNEITSEVLERLPNVQDDEYQADLQNFVEWGVKNFPAENHVFVVCGHGGATRGAVELSPSEMREALTDGVKNANEQTGRDDSIDAIVFNTCLMGILKLQRS
jgi:vacuolar-type H+-ATPase subunit E/Vma4